MNAEHKHRRIRDHAARVATIIAEGATFVGTLKGTANCIVYGRVEGDCDVQGTLVIEASGVWHGRIQANNVVIAGHLDGEANARERLELAPSARVCGSIRGDAIAIAEGAVCEGQVHTSNAAGPSRFTARRNADDPAVAGE